MSVVLPEKIRFSARNCLLTLLKDFPWFCFHFLCLCNVLFQEKHLVWYSLLRRQWRGPVGRSQHSAAGSVCTGLQRHLWKALTFPSTDSLEAKGGGATYPCGRSADGPLKLYRYLISWICQSNFTWKITLKVLRLACLGLWAWVRGMDASETQERVLDMKRKREVQGPRGSNSYKVCWQSPEPGRTRNRCPLAPSGDMWAPWFQIPTSRAVRT